jgi:hypothetical protein
MSQPSETKQPAPVPGDAEAPPRAEPDPTARRGVTHSDPTEPVQFETAEDKKSR